MRSKRRCEPLDLDRDLPTTPEDVAALHRVKNLAPLDLEGYLRFLAQLPVPPAAVLRAKPGPRGRPFELP